MIGEKKDMDDIQAKIATATMPPEYDTFVSFEPFSPIIAEHINEAKNRNAKNAIFESVMTDSRAELLSETNGHKTMLFPGSKGPKTATWEQTKKMADELNNVGIDVTFLPEFEDKPSTDSLIKIGEKYKLADFKYCTTIKANTIVKELERGFRQAGTIVLKLENMNSGEFKNAIEYILRNETPYGDIVLINEYGKVLTITYKEIKSGKYARKTKGFL